MIDLHTHSAYSTAAKDTFMLRQLARGRTSLQTSSSIADKGSLPQMIQEAARKGLSAVSLTDHWTVENVEEARLLAAAGGVSFVPGIEIGAVLELQGHDYEVHLLGYYYNAADPDLQQLCRDARETCARGALAFLNGLKSQSIRLTREDVDRDYPGQFSSWAIRRMLVHRSLAADKWEATRIQQSAVAHTLAHGAVPGLQPGVLHAGDIVRTLHRAGASVFMAHPFWLTRPDMGGVPEPLIWQQIQALLDLGVDGIEAYYPTPEPSQGQQLLAFCQEYQLPVCGGSDSHNAQALLQAPGIPDQALETILRHRRGLQPWS